MKKLFLTGFLVVTFAQAETPAQKTEAVQLSVNKMMCGGCVSRVKKSIESHPGVSDVRVSLETHDATFTCTDANKCPKDKVLEDLKRIGFPSKVDEKPKE